MKACSPASGELFAFSVKFRFPSSSGWNKYDATNDYLRIGLPDSNWRISHVNKNYRMSQTYPEVVIWDSHSSHNNYFYLVGCTTVYFR
jgi:hypothetical protein